MAEEKDQGQEERIRVSFLLRSAQAELKGAAETFHALEDLTRDRIADPKRMPDYEVAAWNIARTLAALAIQRFRGTAEEYLKVMSEAK